MHTCIVQISIYACILCTVGSYTIHFRIQITKQVEELQEQLQQAALNLNQLHQTGKDYGKIIVYMCLLEC